jgi:hypothetical protein
MRAAMRSNTDPGSLESSFSALSVSASLYLGTQLAALNQVCLDLFKRSSLFVPP